MAQAQNAMRMQCRRQRLAFQGHDALAVKSNLERLAHTVDTRMRGAKRLSGHQADSTRITLD
jgi:hypothetical protein